MKIFIIAALAMVALAAADEESMKSRFEQFRKNHAEKREKWNSMTEEERQQHREEHIANRPERPAHHFKDIPEEVRQKIKQKFESLSPETRQKIHDHIHRHSADGARAYNVENVRPARPNFQDLSDEMKQKIREKFEKLTPEQREEIRKLHKDQQIPAVVGPVPAAVEEFEKIRSPQEDILVEDKMTLDIKPDRKHPRFPAAADGDFQKIRNRNDDIMIREKWVNELQAEKRKHNRV